MTPSRVDRADAYDASVLVNCPFDDEYRPRFEAIVFAVQSCGFRARCALEAYDGGAVPLPIPGGTEINRRCTGFTAVLPLIRGAKRLTRAEMTFSDHTAIVAAWLTPAPVLAP